MNRTQPFKTLLTASALLTVASPVWALTIDPNDSNIMVNDGGFIDATVGAQQSLFSNAISEGTGQDRGTGSGDFFFSDIPTTIVNGVQSFVFIFDSQETGPGPNPITVDDIVISVNGNVIWDYDEVGLGGINLLGDTSTPLGNGADIALSIPVLLFSGQGFTGSDALTFSWTQSLSDNGSEEWALSGDGFFDPDDPISPVPLPAAAWFFITALGGLALSRRRRQRTA